MIEAAPLMGILIISDIDDDIMLLCFDEALTIPRALCHPRAEWARSRGLAASASPRALPPVLPTP